jgi:hypothetical protein
VLEWAVNLRREIKELERIEAELRQNLKRHRAEAKEHARQARSLGRVAHRLGIRTACSPKVPRFQRVGARVRYIYTDGPVPLGTVGMIEGWLPRKWSAQIRWQGSMVDSMSTCTPDEYEVISSSKK